MQISFFVGIFASNVITKWVVIVYYPIPMSCVLDNQLMDI